MNQKLMNRSETFLHHYHNDKSCIDDEAFCKALLEDLEESLIKSDGPLPCVPSYLDTHFQIKYASCLKNVLLLDMGGTHLRVALGNVKKKQIEIEKLLDTPMIGLDKNKKYDTDLFFSELINLLDPYITKYHVSFISIVFSYWATVTPSLEGILHFFSKEISIPSMNGCNINQELEKRLEEKYNHYFTITLVNDSVATFLGSLAMNKPTPVNSDSIGLIFGTGVNICYEEKMANILKIDEVKGQTIINTEIADFKHFKFGEFDRAINEGSHDKDYGILEKITAGGYLTSLINLSLYQAFLDKEIKQNKTFKDLIEINDFLNKNNKKEDEIFIEGIVEAFIDRSAYLIAMAVVMVLKKEKHNHKRVNKFYIYAEGTTFYKLKHFKESFSNYVSYYLSEYQINVPFIIKKQEDANLIGAVVTLIEKLDKDLNKQL